MFTYLETVRERLDPAAGVGRGRAFRNIVDGRYGIRCAIVNHRSRREDFDLLVEEVVCLGWRLAA